MAKYSRFPSASWQVVPLEEGSARHSPLLTWLQFAQPLFDVVVWGTAGEVLCFHMQSVSIPCRLLSHLIGSSYQSSEVATVIVPSSNQSQTRTSDHKTCSPCFLPHCPLLGGLSQPVKPTQAFSLFCQ